MGGWVVIIPTACIKTLVFCEVRAFMVCVACGGVQLEWCGGGEVPAIGGAQDARPPAT